MSGRQPAMDTLLPLSTGGDNRSIRRRRAHWATRLIATAVGSGLVLAVLAGFLWLSDPLGWPRTSTMRVFRPFQTTVSDNGGQDASNANVNQTTASTGEGSSIISYGDRLKISFFETSSVPLNGDGAKPSHVVTVMFPRSDLSREYEVDENGLLDVPGLGAISALGRSVSALGSDLASSFARKMGRKIDVQVVITDRLPVYIVGIVRATGSVKYVPGMIVLQAMASSGSGSGGTNSTDVSKTIEYIRQTAQLRHARSALDHFLVKQALLLAENRDDETITVPVEFATGLAEPEARDRLAQIIANANETLRSARGRHRQQQEHAAQQLAVVKLEAEAQRLRAEQSDRLLTAKNNKLQELETIGRNGSVPHFRLTEMRVEIAELRAHQADLRVASAQTMGRLTDAAIAAARAEADRSAGIETNLSAIRQEIENTNQTVTTTEATIRALSDSMAEANLQVQDQNVTITRRVSGRFVVVNATGTTPLRPGDVIRISDAAHLDQPPAVKVQALRIP